MGKWIRGIKEMIEVTREEERQTRGREIESVCQTSGDRISAWVEGGH